MNNVWNIHKGKHNGEVVTQNDNEASAITAYGWFSTEPPYSTHHGLISVAWLKSQGWEVTPAAPHASDSDCNPFFASDDEEGDCPACGVLRGDACRDCEGRGYHYPECGLGSGEVAGDGCLECSRSFGPHYSGRCDQTASGPKPLTA